MEDFETLQGQSTSLFVQIDVPTRSADVSKAMRRAKRVLNRAVRSSNVCDRTLKEHVSRAISVLNQTDTTETALIQNRPIDAVSRIASRVVRRMGLSH